MNLERPTLSDIKKKPSKIKDEYPIDIISACLDEKLFGPWFSDWQSWSSWMTFLKVIFGLGLNEEQYAIFKECTNREQIPEKQINEIWVICGRRGGKSRVLALIATFLACFRDYRPYLSPGEYARILVIAPDRRQARIIFKYIEAFIMEVPILAPLIERPLRDSIELRRQVIIEVHTASFRTVRGYAIAAALLDELAFFRTEDSANPDHEIIDAINPGMLTIPNSMLLCSSSPYARKGELYKAYKNHFGKNDENRLVWKAPTLYMNPSADIDFIKRKYEEDPASAAAEYGAEFRTDVGALIPQEVVDGCTVRDRISLPPIADIAYTAFVDLAGGGKDSFTLAVAHRAEENRKVLDTVIEYRPPFNPEEVVKEMCGLLRNYGLSEVTGDRYGGEWPRDRFIENGVNYIVTSKVKSDIYLELVPELLSGNVELLDSKRLLTQLAALERKTSLRGKKDAIDHPVGGHDDVINAAAGALVNLGAYQPLDLW